LPISGKIIVLLPRKHVTASEVGTKFNCLSGMASSDRNLAGNHDRLDLQTNRTNEGCHPGGSVTLLAQLAPRE